MSTALLVGIRIWVSVRNMAGIGAGKAKARLESARAAHSELEASSKAREKRLDDCKRDVAKLKTLVEEQQRKMAELAQQLAEERQVRR